MKLPLETTLSQTPIELVIATANVGKLKEIRDLLGNGFTVRSAREIGVELPEETGRTFAENAILKARSVAEQTGKIAIADDSGLEVDALGGAPGVHTARYAGSDATDADNRAKLLKALDGVDLADRSARFVSVIAIVFSPDDIETAHGSCSGVIALGERGDGGFGYDSIFQLSDGRTMAEILPSEKNAISHRGIAMRAVSEVIVRRVDRAVQENDL